MRAMRHFDFVTREQVAPGRDSFDISPRRAKVWVESLPVANSGETARLLFAALSEVNGLRFDVGDRYKFLELMRAPVSLISRILERHYMGKPFPLPARDRQVAELSREFQSLMAEGYKILLKDIEGRAALAPIIRRRLFATVVHRAIRYLSRTLVKSYQLYAPYPENIWHELHQLYRLAVRYRIQDWRVADEENELERETRIEDAYKQILLLAISSPYRLRQGDVGRVYNALERWASHCRLNAFDALQRYPKGQFAVPADIDDQPKYLEASTEHEVGVEWMLDTTKLGRVLREQFAYLGHPEPGHIARSSVNIPPDISPQLMGRVMQSWGMMLKRGYSRVEKGGDDVLEVAVGLSAIHHFLGGTTAQAGDIGGDKGEHETELSGEIPLPWAAGALRTVDHKALSFQIKDEGPGGFRLQWSGESSAQAQVGALLGIRRCDGAAKGATWGIGVIRWMRATAEDHMEMGVQMLAPTAEAVSVRACNVKGACGAQLPGLLLPSVPAVGASNSIVGPVFLANFEAAMLLGEGADSKARFTRLIENTGAFARFEYELFGDSGAEPGELRRRKEDDDEESGYDSVWSSI